MQEAKKLGQRQVYQGQIVDLSVDRVQAATGIWVGRS